MRKIRSKLLLMLLTVVALTSNACSAMPIEPRDPLFQPIVEQKFCTDPEDEETCEIKSLCREFRWSGKQYDLFKTWELKKCSGTFGQDVASFNRKKDFIREMATWIKRNCEIN